ncbi:hypothetical protein [Erwinia psidii]|uniref:hypothetical protein n=1 Tax=Erwinia psidii TaxID=69224 RepID=UPI000F52CA40|nr:hypothetical protein [Erwinia psidii]MCX8958484.1 hypothetical protein [Erwinia psidii]MCX8961987.1 hypothetical protein [Erwinia psidii]MCX8965683.1 hypothetical protein [Erwinia psidii]
MIVMRQIVFFRQQIRCHCVYFVMTYTVFTVSGRSLSSPISSFYLPQALRQCPSILVCNREVMVGYRHMKQSELVSILNVEASAKALCFTFTPALTLNGCQAR